MINAMARIQDTIDEQAKTFLKGRGQPTNIGEITSYAEYNAKYRKILPFPFCKTRPGFPR